MYQKHLSRVWFLNQGYRQVPPDEAGGKTLWADGEKGRFLSGYGTELTLHFTPTMRTSGRACHNGKRGVVHPIMNRYFGFKSAHRLMAYAYATEPCPIFKSRKGRPYKGHVHHLIENPMDLRIDNLLFWLDRFEHNEADRRQCALREIAPNGNLYIFTFERLRELQDPRRMSREDFEIELARIAKSLQNMHLVDALTAAEEERNKYC